MKKPLVAGFLISVTLLLSILGCSKSVDSLVASGDAAINRGDYKTAVVQLKSALQQDPEHVRAHWLLGEVYLALEQGADAEKEIRRARQGGLGMDTALPALAQSLLLQDKPDEVLKLVQPTDLAPRAAGEFMAARGLAHLARGETEQADELTAKSLELAPDSKLALTARVRVLAHANQLDEAEQFLATLQQKYPGDGAAWSLMGDIKDVRGDLPEAENAYTTAIEKRPIPYGDQLKRALVRLRQQDLDGALADAEQITKVLQNAPLAWYVKGAAQFLKKDFAAAQESLDRAYQLDGDHLQTAVLLGWVNLELGNLNQAIARAERAMAIAPDVVAVRLLMATLQLRQQDPAQAEQTVRPVVAARPDNLQAKSLLIDSLRVQGRGAEAAPLLEEIAAANPDALDIQTAVGLELIRAREPERALAVLERAVEQAPADPRVSSARVVALIKDGKFDEALDAAQLFHEQHPTDPMGLQSLGVAQAAKGLRAAAIGTFRKALGIAPGDPDVSLKLAELLRIEGDLAAASAVVAQAADMHPSSPALSTSLARLAHLQGRNAEAVELLRKTLQQNPSYRLAQLLLARVLLARNEAVAAVAVLPAEVASNDPVVLWLRGEARLLSGDAVAARDDLEQLTRLLPKSAQAHFKLSLAYAALGDRERQEQALEEARGLDPRDARIGLARARSLAARGRIAEAEALARSFGLAESDPRLLATELRIAEARGDHADRLRLAQRLQSAAPSAQNVLLLAQAQYALGQTGAAEATLQGWLEQHPAADDVAMQLAALYGRTGRSAEAIAVLRPLAEKYPDNAPVLNNLAWYLRDTAPGESLALAEKAAAAAPTNPSILETYATVLALNGQYEQALRAIDAAVRNAAEPVYFKLQRIEILERFGDVPAATSELDALESDGLPEALRGEADAIRRRLDRG